MRSSCRVAVRKVVRGLPRPLSRANGEIRQIADVSMYRAITGRYPIQARGSQSIFTDGPAVEPSDEAREQRFGFHRTCLRWHP